MGECNRISASPVSDVLTLCQVKSISDVVTPDNYLMTPVPIEETAA